MILDGGRPDCLPPGKSARLRRMAVGLLRGATISSEAGTSPAKRSVSEFASSVVSAGAKPVRSAASNCSKVPNIPCPAAWPRRCCRPPRLTRTLVPAPAIKHFVPAPSCKRTKRMGIAKRSDSPHQHGRLRQAFLQIRVGFRLGRPKSFVGYPLPPTPPFAPLRGATGRAQHRTSPPFAGRAWQAANSASPWL